MSRATRVVAEAVKELKRRKKKKRCWPRRRQREGARRK
jgi:hypothetical protein